jgi:hypothetical protein
VGYGPFTSSENRARSFARLPQSKPRSAVSTIIHSEAADAVDLASLTHATFHSKYVDGMIGDRYAFLRAAVAEGRIWDRTLRIGKRNGSSAGERFADRYRDTTPVLLRDSKQRWKALDSWSTKEKFDELFGEYDVSTRVAM